MGNRNRPHSSCRMGGRQHNEKPSSPPPRVGRVTGKRVLARQTCGLAKRGPWYPQACYPPPRSKEPVLHRPCHGWHRTPPDGGPELPWGQRFPNEPCPHEFPPPS